jgi:hypothetical protein
MLIPKLRTLSPEIKGRLLIVVCSYRGGIGNPEPFSFARMMSVLGGLDLILDRLSVLNLRQFIAVNRDFFANPRTLAYQSSLVWELPLSWRKALARRWGWSLWITADKGA